MLVQLALVVVCLLTGSLAQDKDGAYIKTGPAPTKGAKDFDATMYCQVANKGKSSLYWHCNSANGQQDITVGPDVNTNPALNSKYIIDNSGATVGQYNLIITNVTDLDSGKCTCILDTGTGNAEEDGAMLDVMDTASPPLSPPTCIIDKISTPGQTRRIFTEEDDIQLMCESRGGVPLADIHWEIFRVANNGIGVEIVSSIVASENSITAVADYKVTAADDGAYFECIQTHVMQDTPGTCSPRYTNMNGITREVGTRDNPIQVKYRPVLRFVPTSLTVTPTEKTTQTLKCESDSKPALDLGPTIRFKSQNGENLNWNYTVEGKEDEVELQLDQNDVGKVLQCTATNELGISVIEIKIESTGLLPTWILVIIIGGGGLILFVIVAVVCCICFCDDDDKDSHSLPNRSRPGTFQGSELGVDDYYGESENGYAGGYDPEMVNINEFEGGMEMKGDYDTGENNRGYIDDDNIMEDDVDDDDDDIPPVSPIETKASSRTYDEVPID